MNTRNIGLLSVIGLIVIVLFWGCNKYNGIVKQDVIVKQAWGDLQTDYQRRADLIPGLIRTVQEAAKNEKSILENVTKARAGIADLKNDIANAKNPADMEAANAKYRQINSALTIAVEAYPQIRSTEAFINFQNSLEGTENRISQGRKDYNFAVRNFNVAVRQFPGNIVAGFGGFTAKEEFKAQEGADKMPDYDKLWDKK